MEDLLQEGVVETVRNIKQAGISFWVLTGDKLETAEYICKSVKLKDEHDEFVKLVRVRSPKKMLKIIDCFHYNQRNLREVGGRPGLSPRKCSFWTSTLSKRSSSFPAPICCSWTGKRA